MVLADFLLRDAAKLTEMGHCPFVPYVCRVQPRGEAEDDVHKENAYYKLASVLRQVER